MGDVDAVPSLQKETALAAPWIANDERYCWAVDACGLLERLELSLPTDEYPHSMEGRPCSRTWATPILPSTAQFSRYVLGTMWAFLTFGYCMADPRSRLHGRADPVSR